MTDPEVGGPLPPVSAADPSTDMRDLMKPEQLAAFFRRNHTIEALRHIVWEHTPKQGRCPACRMAVVGAGCFLLQAAEEALRPTP